MFLVASPLLLSIFSLCLVSVSLISMWLGMFLLVFILYWTLCTSWTLLTISFSISGKLEIFDYNLFQNFLILFLFLFFFWDLYKSTIGVFDVVLEFSETVLSSFHSFHFILLFRNCLHHFIFQLTDSFFCFRYSAIDSV